MKQIYTLNFAFALRSIGSLALILLAGTVTGATQPPAGVDSTRMRRTYEVEAEHSTDLVITAAQLRAINPVNLWDAISFYEPSIGTSWEENQGASPLYGAGEMTLRGSKRWGRDERSKPARPTYVIDGARVDARKFFDMDINDVRRIIIRKDPASLTRYGIRGADGVVEMETFKPVKGAMKIRYSFDGVVEWADLSSYHLMSAAEGLGLLQREGLTTGSAASMQQYLEAGTQTDWPRELTRTVFSHRHKITIDGGDDHVKYALTGRISPANKGVLRGSEKEILGIGAYIEYRYKSFRISNELTYDKVATDSKLFGAFGDYAHTPAWLEPGNGRGGYLKTMGFDDDLRKFENPLYEMSLGSFHRNKTYSVFDNVNMSLDLGAGFALGGRFSYVRDQIRTDTYVSPSSWRYATAPAGTYTGRYGIARSAMQTFDGRLALTYAGQSGRSSYGASLAADLFGGVYNMESYAGVGITTDKMGYISFTQSYDFDTDPYAWRSYDRTAGGTLEAYYAFDDRYEVRASARLDRSSLLAPQNRTALFYGVSVAWNIARESFLRDAGWLDRLTLAAAFGTTGAVDASNADYVVSYGSDIGNEYVYNYYLIGSSITGMPNPSLRWRTGVNRSLSLQAAVARRIDLRVNLYWNDAGDLLTVAPLNQATGYRYNASNGGRIRNSGVEYYLNARVYERPGFSVSFFTAGSHNRNRIEELPAYFAAWYNAGLAADEAPLVEGQSVNAVSAVPSVYDGTVERVTGPATIVGTTDPDLKGNFGVSVNWRQLTFGAAFDYRIGGSIFNQTLYDVQFGSALQTLDRRALQSSLRHAFEGDPARLSRFVERLDALNFSTLQVGYRFRSQLIEKIRLRNLALYVTGNNLFYRSSVDRERGTIYPFSRNVTLSLRATF